MSHDLIRAAARFFVLSRDDEKREQDPAEFAFIPETDLALCCDCGGGFMGRIGKCPGCGSTSWVLAVPMRSVS